MSDWIDCYDQHEAMQHLVDAFCQCAMVNHSSGGMFFGKTTDKMEWAVQYWQMGKRDRKTGRIEIGIRMPPRRRKKKCGCTGRQCCDICTGYAEEVKKGWLKDKP